MKKQVTKTTTTKKTVKAAVAEKTLAADQQPKPTVADKAKKATPKKETKAVKPPKKAETAIVKEAAPKASEAPKAVKQEKPKAKAAPKPAKKEAAAAVKESAPQTSEATVKKAAAKAAKPALQKTAPKQKAAAAKTAKSTTAKTAKKPAAKPAKAKAAPKAADTKADQAKADYYQSLSIDDCIQLMQQMNVQYQYDDYYRLLMDETDLKKLEQNIIKGNGITAKKYDFAKDGYDQALVAVTLAKVADTMDLKAADFPAMKQAMQKAVATSMSADAEQNAAAYLEAFQTAEKLLMLGQRKDIHTAREISAILDQDTAAFFDHFFQFAYDLLPTWQYNDVKFYEDFAYAILSQYSDLFEEQQLRIQMDVADLYIKHGDYAHGDEIYGYILRDNQIKDYIYFRYASVYQDIDMNKAKAIAYSSLQYVNDRFTYYPHIMNIVNNN